MRYSFGLGESSLDHRRREEFPAIFTIMRVLEELMKELSVFIDESGDFGEITERPAYYLVTLLFHDQKNEIASNVKKLEDSTKNSGFDFEYIHTGPVIRGAACFNRTYQGEYIISLENIEQKSKSQLSMQKLKKEQNVY